MALSQQEAAPGYLPDTVPFHPNGEKQTNGTNGNGHGINKARSGNVREALILELLHDEHFPLPDPIVWYPIKWLRHAQSNTNREYVDKEQEAKITVVFFNDHRKTTTPATTGGEPRRILTPEFVEPLVDDVLVARKAQRKKDAGENLNDIEKELLRKAKDAKDKLILGGGRLVYTIAGRIAQTSEERYEFIQDGEVGLVTAVDEYRRENGDFVNFAARKIRSEIKAALSRQIRSRAIAIGDRDLDIPDASISLVGDLSDEERLLESMTYLDKDERIVVLRKVGMGGEPGLSIAQQALELKKSKTHVKNKLTSARIKLQALPILPAIKAQLAERHGIEGEYAKDVIQRFLKENNYRRHQTARSLGISVHVLDLLARSMEINIAEKDNERIVDLINKKRTNAQIAEATGRTFHSAAGRINRGMVHGVFPRRALRPPKHRARNM